MVEISDLFEETTRLQASDLLLTAGVSPMVRVHGNLKRLDHPPLSPDEVIRLTYSLLNEQQRLIF